MAEQLDALRQAAVTLLAAASPGAVLAATRALLADWEPNTLLPATAAGSPQGTRRTEGLNGTATPAPPPAAALGAARGMPTVTTLAGAGAAYAAKIEAAEATWAASAAAPKSDELAAWEALRQRVRETRQARGVSIQDLAEQLGMAKTTLENALQCRALPSGPTRTRLTSWLATPAPEVAVESAEPFRPNGTDHHDDGGDQLDTDDSIGHLAA
jgi:DNA-binding transcriptional regulator YiaG